MTGSVCSFPLEYCEFGSSFSKCKEWLQGTNSDLYDKYYSEGESHITIHISLMDLSDFRCLASETWYYDR